MLCKFASFSLTVLVLTSACLRPGQEESNIETVTLPSPDSPLIAVRLLFKAGSIHDPVGKEGLAALTGLMVGDAGTAQHTYSELIGLLYPMASSFEVDTDREITVISGLAHSETLADYSDLLTEAVLQPGFAESDFNRNKEQLLSFLTTTLRATNDELLGLESIQQVIFDDHPYKNSPAGTVEGLENITLEDVKAFYQRHYTQANLMLGIAGNYSEAYLASLKKALSALPVGEASNSGTLPAPSPPQGRQFTLIEKETHSVGIHFGHSLPINRSHPDFYPLMVANSFLGEHRTFHGRLVQQLRSKRGLNYGDYSYIEYWHLPPFTMTPTPGYPRHQQYFSVWVRPVVPTTAHFALRNAIHEVDRLIERGLIVEEFELTRDFLINYSKLWAQTLADRLAVLMDSFYYEMPYFIDEIETRLNGLTVEDVNEAIKKYLQSDDFHAVLVTNNAATVEAYLQGNRPSPMHYNSDPEPEVIKEDRTIQALTVNPASVKTIPVGEMFQR